MGTTAPAKESRRFACFDIIGAPCSARYLRPEQDPPGSEGVSRRLVVDQLTVPSADQPSQRL